MHVYKRNSSLVSAANLVTCGRQAKVGRAYPNAKNIRVVHCLVDEVGHTVIGIVTNKSLA